MIMFPASRAKGAVNAGATFGPWPQASDRPVTLRAPEKHSGPESPPLPLRLRTPSVCRVWPLIGLRSTWSPGSHQTVTQDHGTRTS